MSQPIISGDSHVIEPADLFTKALSKKYGEDVLPRILHEYKGEKADHYFTGIEYIRIDEVVEGDEELQKKLLARLKFYSNSSHKPPLDNSHHKLLG